MRRLVYAIAALFVAAGLAIIGTTVANADTPVPDHPPKTVSLGVYVQSYNNDTDATIDCGYVKSTVDPRPRTRTRMETVDGDATLFMEGTKTQRVTCTITITGYSTA